MASAGGWWSEQFDAVSGGGVTEGGRVDRAGVGQPAGRRRLAGFGGEPLESGRGGDLKGPQRLVRADQERVCTLIGGRAAQIFEAVRRAADDNGEVAQVWETLLRNRRRGAAMVVERVRSLGPLRQGSDVERAVDVVWFLNDPAHYDALVTRCGWSEGDFREWLSDQLARGVLTGAGSRGSAA
ncbi:hypothetical protein AB0M79_21625 [Polymorphospora sp. NPDC051019]|uniref:hypothetical protein n=1 Tax=Polymorphospora sp. NPDC051019 TaxID=3155725 RepID=UPI00344259A2